MLYAPSSVKHTHTPAALYTFMAQTDSGEEKDGDNDVICYFLYIES